MSNQNSVGNGWELEDFAEDFKFLLDSGLTRKQAADRLGLEMHVVETRIKRLNLWCPERRHRAAAEWLEKLIGLGEPFTVSSFPSQITDDAVQVILTMAQRAKKIVRTQDKVRSVTGTGMVYVYRPA